MEKGCKYAVRVNFRVGSDHMHYDYYRRTLHDCMSVIETFKKVVGPYIDSFNMVYCGDPN